MRVRTASLVVAIALLAVGAVPVPQPAAATPFYGSMGGRPLDSPIIDFAARPAGGGYWMTGADGGVFAFGRARFFGSMGGRPLDAPIVAMASTPRGDGYWFVGSDGGVFAFGAARFFGSMGGRPLASPIVDLEPTPTGRGYWMLAGDGGLFAFGDARFHGSAGATRLVAPAVAMDSTADGRGYWIATADGGVLTFGSAAFHGSAGALPLAADVVDFAATRDGRGYWLTAGDGGVLSYGSARFYGSTGGIALDAPIVAFEPTRRADGYWLTGGDGGVFAFPGTVPRPPRLRVSTVVSGLDIPWDIGFLPDGTMLFTERPGRVSALVGGAVRVLATPPDVVAVGEGGMLGLAVDPRFARNRLVYTCSNTTHGDIRVVKWRVNASVTRLKRGAAIVTGMPASAGGRHSGCRPRFGPDGYLWIGTGDAAMGTNPQSDSSLGGKVLRVDRNGAAAPGNPSGRLWYTKGHRNVQGLAFRPGTGTPFSVEHGPDRDDEVNVLRAGGNYGWDPVPGYNESVPMTDVVRFPDAVRPAWRSGYPTIAPSGGTFLSGRRWGTWDGAFLMAVLKGAHLRLLRFDGSNRLTGERIVLTGYGRLRTAVQGPGGRVYVTTSNGGNDRILRITPT